MLQLEVLIVELATIDGLTTSSVTTGEVATLAHEVGDDSVESTSLEVQGLARLAPTLLTSAQGPEVLGSPGDYIGVELHGKKKTKIR